HFTATSSFPLYFSLPHSPPHRPLHSFPTRRSSDLIASGVNPEYGIYTTIIAGLIVALFGGSRFQIAGPTGAFIPILLGIVLQYGYEDLLIAGFLAGILLMIMSFFKLGSLITYIP